jgi:hypothetical protein
MAGRIPIYRRVGHALQMRPGRADRGICTSCHEMPSRALPPTTAQLSERRKGAALDLASLRTSQLQLAFRGRIGEARDQIAIAHDALSDMDIAVFAERARRELPATSGRRGRRTLLHLPRSSPARNCRLPNWCNRVFPTGRSAA